MLDDAGYRWRGSWFVIVDAPKMLRVNYTIARKSGNTRIQSLSVAISILLIMLRK